ncbi:MAG TPA: FAD-dependent oxidoreductase [Chromatiaceae bacterium]|jgi:NADPH-dependent glutamate synthase beta subunit-like oxidoreductase/Pyruvate/2-oxoacid:ferredoxin oxidoreductase delta subunit|nr:FAD-dependent oxidoreductase [Chromatiaceae bacterium]HIB84866.1 FAD-dependent oxidoreductase [Chromatiaceae bacterium]HIN81345.1 FAD-dependent oxidoreductase [Chromatiales bacterium]HIO13649.1 FAD-dependent oxidoreductase [Chromatiales bacterium]HIO54668.1 FAD-dependent oxidoreductase [Chromatiales bacterium]
MSTPTDEIGTKLTFRKYDDGDYEWGSMHDMIFVEDTSHKCPTYVHKTPPCQGSCPSGEDIRGWLGIVRGMEPAPEGMDWQEYAFLRSTDANPFPSQMGRVCPAPCEDGCNRNEVEDFVGINAVEQFIGDNAKEKGYKFPAPPPVSGKRVAIIGGGPAGMAAAYQLRRMGHASTIFDDHEELGGMMRYGIPGYRTPRDFLDHEIQRIIDMGDIDVKLNTRVGKDVSLESVEEEYDAVLWALGCKSGRPLPCPGSDAENCVSGVAFLEAFNQGRLHVTANRVVCVGGGDTSIDVVSVARRLGHIEHINPKDRPELVVHGYVAHDAAHTAAREGADVTLTSLFPKADMTAAEHEVSDALTEGVTILDGVMPVLVVQDENGRATALRMARCEMVDGRPTPVEGSEFDLEADLIVSAIGQGGDLEGLDGFDNGRGLIDADKYYQVPGKEGHFVCGDIIRPHLLTTAIGQASVVAETIHEYMSGAEHARRPKVDVHHFDLLDKLKEVDLSPDGFDPAGEHSTEDARRGTNTDNRAVHNYEDRSAHEIIPSDELFLGHFGYEPRLRREEVVPTSEEVLGHFQERVLCLETENAQAEAGRCMSCGMCFECDNCVIFCPQDAVFRVKKDAKTTGRYVDTDYDRCIGCHICSEVCPTGYIKMGLGE